MIILLGPTGAGKSVQAEIIAKKHGLKWISVGNLLRSSDNPKVKNQMQQGVLVDNELVNEALLTAINETSQDEDIILDGFPRSLDQAQWLHEKTTERLRSIEHIVVINVTKEETTKRLKKRNRQDDTKESIEKRWDSFLNQTKPVIEYFREKLDTKEVDGIGTIEEVTERIEKAIGYSD